VTPTVELAEPTEPAQPGKRWSFVWRPPSGDVCPECRFPLGRYARRMKWIRLFIFGIMVLAVDVALLIIGEVGAGSMPAPLLQVLGVIGGLSLIAGLIGLIVGGRSDVGLGGS
jgi:membrane protease YdiL (CAAX protease family)